MRHLFRLRLQKRRLIDAWGFSEWVAKGTTSLLCDSMSVDNATTEDENGMFPTFISSHATSIIEDTFKVAFMARLALKHGCDRLVFQIGT